MGMDHVRDRGCLGRKGFSLTEVTIAVVVILILIGIVIPNYNTIRFRADESKARANLYSMYMAQKEYRLDRGLLGEPEMYAQMGDIDVLQTYVDFSQQDGTWQYQINSADANTFLIAANHQVFITRSMTIDQTGTITRVGY